MRANLLAVSASDFPPQITQYLEEHGFKLFFSRGVIKTNEVLKKEKIDAVVWLYLGHERALAIDLLSIFNANKAIPVVLITQSYDELDFADDIEGLFANLDLNDDLEDILRSVELACNIAPTVEPSAKSAAETKTPEIDFKNAVSHIFEQDQDKSPQNLDDDSTQNITTWHAVDHAEKEILSTPLNRDNPSILKKVRNWFNRRD